MNNGIKIVIIGAGSGYTPELIEGLLNRYEKMPVSEVWLVDVEKGIEKLNIIHSVSQNLIKKSGFPIKIFSSLNRKAALKQADFVLTQLRVGQLDARILDENVPLSFDTIGQETNGPGELMKAFRTIPVMLNIVADMEEVCPEAWLINFANPAGILAEAILNYSNWTKVISICNGPLLIKQQIAEALEVPFEKIFVEFVGLNHLVFAKKIYLDGKDVTDKIVSLVAKKHKKVDNPGTSDWEKDFLIGLGMIPMSYLKYYWKTDEVLEEQLLAANTTGSRAIVAKKMEKELFKIYQESSSDRIPELMKKRGGSGYSEAACGLIYSIYSDQQDIQIVNTKNNGAIKGLDDQSVVELNAVITNHGAIPLVTGALPESITGIIHAVKAYEMVACQAAVTGNYEKALVAMTINPLVSGDKKAKMILDDLLLKNEEYLPQFDLTFLKEGES